MDDGQRGASASPFRKVNGGPMLSALVSSLSQEVSDGASQASHLRDVPVSQQEHLDEPFKQPDVFSHVSHEE